MAVNLPKRSVMSDLEIRADLIQVLESGIIKTEHVFHAADGVLGILNLKTGKCDDPGAGIAEEVNGAN